MNSKQEIQQKVQYFVRAGYACLNVVSHEEYRVQEELMEAVFGLAKPYAFYHWTAVDGIQRLPSSVEQASGEEDWADDKWATQQKDEFEILEFITNEVQPQSVVLLKDYHMFIEPQNGAMVRSLKNLLAHCRANKKTVVILGCRSVIPPEIEKEVTVIDWPLPCEDDFIKVIDRLVEENPSLERPEASDLLHTYDSLKGQTALQVQNSVSISAVRGSAFDPGILAEEKSRNIKQSGLLEVIPVNLTRADIGGLENYIDHVDQVNGLRRPEVMARYPNLRNRGILMVGPPGTGKTLASIITAHILHLQLYRFDLSKLKAGIVGESETNMKNVLKLLKANAPCVCQMDEIEKMMAGVESSGKTDGGTTSGMFGQLLTEMESGLDGVYFVGTCNDMSSLDSALLRRFDEYFFVDFPNAKEREIIWKIHLRKQGIDPEGFDLEMLSTVSEGYTGAEIEKSVKKGIQFVAWKDEEPTTETMMEAVGRTTPISNTMKEQMAKLRAWCNGRTQHASRATVVTKKDNNRRSIDV